MGWHARLRSSVSYAEIQARDAGPAGLLGAGAPRDRRGCPGEPSLYSEGGLTV